MSRKARWGINGALIGLAIVLADYLLEWRGPMFLPWEGAQAITSNVVQMLTMIFIPAFIGVIAAIIADRRTTQTLSRK